jgi:hypothetical protein
MRYTVRTLKAALVALVILHSTGSLLAGAERGIRGVVADESAGVLAGVTVVATSSDGQVLAAVVTNGAGVYSIGPLAPGRVMLTFQLEGFTTASVPVAVTDGDSQVNQRLAIAPRSETVLVHARLPTPPAPPPPRPRPVTKPVAEHDRDSICGPAKIGPTIESLGTVQSRRDADNGLYSEGDELIVSGGRNSGLEVGRNVVVRRSFRVDLDKAAPTGEHTSGLVQIIEAGESTSVALVIYACDEMMAGDRLASFTPEPLRPPEPAGVPAYEQPARILFADDQQLLGMPRRLMVIDRGASSGLRAGQRLTLFRRLAGRRDIVILGDAVIVATRPDSATIRVGQASDAISFGDWAAPQHGPSSRLR